MLTKIEWTATTSADGIVHPGYTFNPWSGCSKISAGCANCYAANLPPAMRRGAEWGPGADRVHASDSYWKQPYAWVRKATQTRIRPKVFCASTADVFEDRADLDRARGHLFDLITDTPELDWLIVTKRPEKMADWARRRGWPNNAWAGTSVEDQRAADTRIPHLLRVPARVRFLSCEPLLGPVDLRYAAFDGSGSFSAMEGLHWVIVGGESGPGARPMHPDWARSLRDQCQAADVPFFFKQWGEWAPGNGGPGGDLYERDRSKIESGMFTYNNDWVGGGPNPFRQTMDRIGKKAAGRLLDGVEHNAFPR